MKKKLLRERRAVIEPIEKPVEEKPKKTKKKVD